MTYDSRPDTVKHIDRVRELVGQVQFELGQRALDHDQTKLQAPELEIFDSVTEQLQTLTYGSDEYRSALAEMKPALDHHYAAYRHHPEHFGPAGIHSMNLIDLLEMLADWKAAGERHADGSLRRSISVNAARYGYDDDLENLLIRTAADLGWLD